MAVETPTGAPAPSAGRGSWLAAQLTNLAPLVTLLFLVAVFSALSPSFATIDNFANVMRQVSITAIIATGLTFVILTAEIDLSVAALANVAGIAVAFFTLQESYVNIANLPLPGFLAIILALLTALLLTKPKWRRDLHGLRTAVRSGSIPRWQLYGGVAGALLVAAQGLTVSTIGVALFIVAIVAGQTGSALSVDHAGLGPAGPASVTPARTLGALVTLVAVAVSTGLIGGNPPTAAVLLLTALPLLAGAGTSVQQAINGRVAASSSAWIATWNNFLVGFTTLVIAFGLTLLLPGSLTGLPSNPVLYLGGLIGVAFIATAAVVVGQIGVLLFGLSSVAGQVLSAIVVDLVIDPSRIQVSTYVGAALTLLGVAIAAWGRTSRRPR